MAMVCLPPTLAAKQPPSRSAGPAKAENSKTASATAPLRIGWAVMTRTPLSNVRFAGCAPTTMAMLRMNRTQIQRVFGRTFFQMKIPIPTIACMLGLSYVTRYAGMDATLGIAFAETGLMYPFQFQLQHQHRVQGGRPWSGQ